MKATLKKVKKIMTVVQWSTFAVFVIAWGVMGVYILNNDFDFLPVAYIALGAWVVFVLCQLIRIFTNRCPHCGRLHLTRGDYCSYCGKKIEE